MVDCHLWRALPPPGFVSIGDVCTTHSRDQPSDSRYRCVRVDVAAVMKAANEIENEHESADAHANADADAHANVNATKQSAVATIGIAVVAATTTAAVSTAVVAVPVSAADALNCVWSTPSSYKHRMHLWSHSSIAFEGT
jgi:hypothetical protein